MHRYLLNFFPKILNPFKENEEIVEPALPTSSSNVSETIAVIKQSPKQNEKNNESVNSYENKNFINKKLAKALRK